MENKLWNMKTKKQELNSSEPGGCQQGARVRLRPSPLTPPSGSATRQLYSAFDHLQQRKTAPCRLVFKNYNNGRLRIEVDITIMSVPRPGPAIRLLQNVATATEKIDRGQDLLRKNYKAAVRYKLDCFEQRKTHKLDITYDFCPFERSEETNLRFFPGRIHCFPYARRWLNKTNTFGLFNAVDMMIWWCDHFGRHSYRQINNAVMQKGNDQTRRTLRSTMRGVNWPKWIDRNCYSHQSGLWRPY